MKLNYKLNLVITLFFSVAILLTSCNSELTKSKILEEEVMSIHDEIMPRMTDLQSAKKELEMALGNGADSTIVFELLNQVDEADESMMVWMEEYEGPGADASEVDKLNYLNLELSRIKEVKENMLSALQAVNKFTTQYIKPINDTIQ